MRWDHEHNRESIEQWALTVALAQTAALAELLTQHECGEPEDAQKAGSSYLFAFQRELSAAFARAATEVLDAGLRDAQSRGVAPLELSRNLDPLVTDLLEKAAETAAEATAKIIADMACAKEDDFGRDLERLRRDGFSGSSCGVGFPFTQRLWLECATPTRPIPLSVAAGVLRVRTPISPVAPGGSATVSVQTTPGVACTIGVRYDGRDETAGGLAPKVADPVTGVVSWTWTVEPQAPLGDWPITFVCGDVSLPSTVSVRPKT